MSYYFTNDENLRSEYRNIVYNYKDFSFNFTSDLGVFSKDRVDYASKLLIESYFECGKKTKKVLDVGCGYGLIGITISKIMESDVDMIDVNKTPQYDLNILGCFLYMTLLRVDVIEILLAEPIKAQWWELFLQKQLKQWGGQQDFITNTRSQKEVN